MKSLNNYYLKTLKFSLINKFFYTDTKELPKLKKIVLTFNLRQASDIRALTKHLVALEQLTNQKGSIITTTKPNIQLRIKKGGIVGCKVTIRKKKAIEFIFKIITEIVPNMDKLSLLKTKEITHSNYSGVLRNLLNFDDLQKFYSLFNNLSTLNLTLVQKGPSSKESAFILNALKFPKLSRYNSIGRVQSCQD